MTPLRLRPSILSALGIVLACLVPASAQNPIARVNQNYADIRAGSGEDPGQRSDLALFPKLMAMTPPPQGVETAWKAQLMHPASQLWKTAEAWAVADSQKAVLEALNTITNEPDYTRAMALGQPYGVDELTDRELDFVAEGLYTELDAGGAPMLIAADFRYLDRVKWMVCLAHVEATRRASVGDVAEALDLITDLCYFGRQMADREFVEEKVYGMELMSESLERIRDIVYLDLRKDKVLRNRQDVIREIITRLDEVHADRTDGYIGLRRLTFPRADLIAAQQAVDALLDSAGAKAAPFAAVMSQMTGSGNPLRLFSEYARWQSIAQEQEGIASARRHLEAVYADWERRWRLNNPFDREMERLPHITRVPLRSNIIVAMTLGNLGELLDARWKLQVEVAGTRQALGIMGVYYSYGDWPNDGAAVRPSWLPQEEFDPMNPNRTARLHYFVPGRAGAPSPLEIDVAQTGTANFLKRLDEQDFVLCSVGSDGARNFARNVQNTVEETFNTDYLLWPPVLSLTREELIRTRQLR